MPTPKIRYPKILEAASNQSRPCSYILFSVLFQTKSSLVWKSYTQKLRTIFQNNSSLVWKEKKWFCNTQIPNQIQIGLENFDDHCQCPENSKPISVWFGTIIDYYQRLEPWTNSSFISEILIKKGKTLKHTSTRLTNNYVKVLAKSNVLEE